MIKTILTIVIAVTLFGVIFFIIVRNLLKRRVEMLVEQEKEDQLNNSK